jgi:hypothetical protein
MGLGPETKGEVLLMAQVESGPGRSDPALLVTVVPSVKHAGTHPINPTLAVVSSAQSHAGVSRQLF